MPQHRVFIASAGKSIDFASALQNAMESLVIEKDDKDFWEVIPWFDIRSSLSKALGPTILEQLIKECKLASFAVILMTEDDIKINGKEGEKEEMVARDNCVFEAGLFMGGLGLDRTRSVIATTVREGALPSDLWGIHYLHIDREAINEGGGRDKEVEALAKKLYSHAQNLKKPPKRPFLSIYTDEELVARERPVAEGGDIISTPKTGVVINTTEPVEIKISLARRVVKNMKKDVQYYYFFRDYPDRMHVVAQLIQALVLARMGVSDDLGKSDRVKTIRDRADEVVKVVKEIRETLFIYMLPKDRNPLYFCVHNALEDKYAKCYLRYPGERDLFIPWAEYKAATIIAKDLLKLRALEEENVFFYPTEYFDLNSAKNPGRALKKALEANLREQFSKDIYEKIRQYCFA